MIEINDRIYQFDQLELGDLAGPHVEAKKLYSNLALIRVAAACIHRGGDRALEYLRTAPVLVLGVSFGAKKVERACEYAQIAGMFRNKVVDGPKLRDLMRFYRIAPQLRAIDGKALSPNKWSIVAKISREVGPSTLSQCIPGKSFHQHLWLYALDAWERLTTHRMDGTMLYPEWAASRLNLFTQQEQLRVVRDVADFARRVDQVFDTRWTFDQAHQAMERWHFNLGRMNPADRFKANHGLEYEDEFAAVAGLPGQSIFGGLDFVPVNSGQKLFEEGRAMHHCVSSYSTNCAQGGYRVYSIRGARYRRLATFGLRLEKGWWLSDQVKGHCNRPVATKVHAAVQEFMAAYRKSRGGK